MAGWTADFLKSEARVEIQKGMISNSMHSMFDSIKQISLDYVNKALDLRIKIFTRKIGILFLDFVMNCFIIH